METRIESELVFTTRKGYKVPFVPINTMVLTGMRRGQLKKYREAGKPIDPPTYVVKSAGGAEITVPHDEKSVQQTKEPDTQWKWEEHLACKRQANQEYMLLTLQTIFEDGVMLQLPEDESWIEKHKSRLLEVPEDLGQRRTHWLTYEIFLPVDYKPFIKLVLTESGKGTGLEEKLETALAAFPD